MNETGVIAGAVIVLWLGSVEWRLRNSISKDRFNDLIARINRIEEKIDTLLKSAIHSSESSVIIDKD